MRGDRIREERQKRGLTLRQLAQKANISFGYLYHIEHGRNIPSVAVLRRIADALGVPVSEFIEGEEDREAGRDLVRIPLLGVTHAGSPTWAEETLDDYLLVPRDMLPAGGEGDFFALRVRGQCMEPVIPEGSTVIVHRQPQVEPGRIAVVFWPDANEAQIRRVYHSNGRVVLQAENPNFPPIILSRSNVRILGRVVKVLVDVDASAAAEPAMP
ncbi:MAG TPA: XRE family transcriptional regulator [Calditerricola sp.]